VFKFKLGNEKTALIELTSFKSFVSEVSSFYFGPLPLLLIKPSCTSACENLDDV